MNEDDMWLQIYDIVESKVGLTKPTKDQQFRMEQVVDNLTSDVVEAFNRGFDVGVITYIKDGEEDD
jgi:hypothetical protein